MNLNICSNCNAFLRFQLRRKNNNEFNEQFICTCQEKHGINNVGLMNEYIFIDNVWIKNKYFSILSCFKYFFLWRNLILNKKLQARIAPIDCYYKTEHDIYDYNKNIKG